MKPVRIVDQYFDDEEPGFLAVGQKDERLLRDAAAYCTFKADEAGTALKPLQMAQLLERFYGFQPASPQPAEALDLTVERRLYHVRGKPLPMKAALLANRALHRDGLSEAIERLALINEAAE